MTSWTGYMSFLSDEPICGIRPHPGCAPNIEDAQRPTTGADWAAIYTCTDSERDRLQEEVVQDAASMQEEGIDDVEPDMIFPVRIEANGDVAIFLNGAHTDVPDVVHSARAIFKAYAMPFPESFA